MTTITYRPGGSGPLVLRFEDDAGEAVTHGAAEVRVSTPTECLIIPGTLAGEEWEFDLPTLPPRLYRMSIYTAKGGDGPRFWAEMNLAVEGGC